MSNELGQRGEALFYVLITKSYGRVKPIFRPQFLGDKWPTVDFIVELVKEEGYVLSANGEWLQGMSSLPTTFPLNKINQDLLWKKVKAFWMKVEIRPKASHFIDPRWR